MNIGFIGLGKLGLPCAAAIASKGHFVYGYDINKNALESYMLGKCNFYEPKIDELLNSVKSNMIFCETVDEVIKNSNIIFVAVQTPHPPEMDGSVRFNHVRKDFDYSYLIEASKEIVKAIDKNKKYKIISIISTVLPGTTREYILPEFEKIDHKLWDLCYNPSFIAMGQTVKDYLQPEFTLIGSENSAGDVLAEFYNTLHSAPKLRMKWEEAELTKVIYNTYIGFKIVYANMIMQICEEIGMNCDVISNALSKAKDRIISPKYMFGGMGDGGGCHPRDNIALANLSDKLNLGYNLFDTIMTIREKQTEYLADLALKYKLPIVIMGETYKPDTNLTYGSPSILLAHILEEKTGEYPMMYDPLTKNNTKFNPSQAYTYIIGTNWEQFKTFPYSKNSIVIDPWGYIKTVPKDVTLINVGRK